jgi:hypothetical protein
MEKKEVGWGLMGVIGLFLLIIGYYVLNSGFIMVLGVVLVFISLFYGYKDRKRVLT